tara:strand:- start:338 stop:454 length:117 start_codon:yes stop_codon:yes gene_type:complete
LTRRKADFPKSTDIVVKKMQQLLHIVGNVLIMLQLLKI